jgi:4-hydroxy-2-oxoheptanedioate aldolase
MRLNSAKRRMLEGKPAIGAASGLGSPLAAEILSDAGYDFVLVDNQHGAWDDGNTMLAVRSICLGPAVPMARVRQNDYAAIGRLLDSGMLGIVVPMVNSAEEARAAAYASRYPPRGGRSAGPFGARFYGADYAGQIDDEVFLAVQIETAQAVRRAEEILAVEGVDGCWVGPGDLANTMGVDLGTPEGRQAHESAIMEVLEACRRTGKIPGIAGGDNAPYWLERGFLFVTSVSDTGLVVSGSEAFLRKLGRTVS